MPLNYVKWTPDVVIAPLNVNSQNVGEDETGGVKKLVIL